MMNYQQYLLTKLAEECNEVAQMALKTQQFGAGEIMKNQPLTNYERTHLELDDLNAIIELLNENCGFGYVPSKENIEAKRNKINRYLQYSVDIGMVTMLE